jgi:hypothetical protein
MYQVLKSHLTDWPWQMKFQPCPVFRLLCFIWWLLCRDHKPFSVKAISIFIWFTFIILLISESEDSSCLWSEKSWSMSSAKCRRKYLVSIHYLISIKRTNLITNSCINLRKSLIFHNIPNQTLVCSYFEKLVFTLKHFNLRRVWIVFRKYEGTFFCTEYFCIVLKYIPQWFTYGFVTECTSKQTCYRPDIY